MLNFYLIDTFFSTNKLDSDSDKIICLIFDKTNYSTSTLTIDYNKSEIKVSCDCSGVCILTKFKKNNNIFHCFFKKQKECNHIKWMSVSYFNCHSLSNWTHSVNNWTIEKINTFQLFHRHSVTPNGNNIECSICLDDINYTSENTYYCNVCKNSIHNKCWNKFIILNPNNCKLNCCICRTGRLRNFIL